MTLVRIRPRARRDLEEARAWYELQRRGLGERFGFDVDELMQRIARSPLIYQEIHKTIRRAMTRHFPYAVYHLVESERIIVLRVLHQARNPDEWNWPRSE